MYAVSPFDSILEHKVKFGRYQYITYIFASLTHFSDGSEIVGLSILLPVLKKEWDITDDQQGLLGSILFFGIFFGSILGGYVSDKLGRRAALLYSNLLQFIIGVISTMVNSVAPFILMRGLFGLIIGFTIPLAPSLASELTPVHNRGRGIVAVNAFFSIGSFYAVIVAKFCLDSLQSGNWRAMLIWCSLPSLVVYIGTLIYIKESPRFLIANGRMEEGVEVLNHMAQVNDPDNYQNITEEEILELKKWQEGLFAHTESADLKALFKPKYKYITILVSSMWFTLNFVYYGMTFILPFMLSQLEVEQGSSTQGLDGLMYTIVGEVPSILVGLYIIEHESFGRKGTLIYSSIIAFILFVLVLMLSISWLIPLLSVSRMLVKLSFSMMYSLTTEIYPTTVRTAGLGLTSGIGRIGSSIMPYILMEVLKTGVMAPVFTFAVFIVAHGIAAYSLPYDTRGRQLDLLEEERERSRGSSEKQVMIAMQEISKS